MENENLQDQIVNKPTVAPPVMEIWAQLQFDGKENFLIDEQGNILLRAADHYPERTIGSVSDANATTLLNMLIEKFNEVKEKVTQSLAELEAPQELIRAQGKLQRLHTYLLNVCALGDFPHLFALIEQHQKNISQLLQANEAIRLQLVQKAEALRDAPEFKATTEEFRALIEEWKNAPFVEKSVSDQLWERIEAARNYFYERKRAYQQDIEIEMMQNLDLKLELCEKAEALSHSTDWKNTTEAYKQLMEQWKGIGRVASAEKNEELWTRFINAKNIFFDRKAEHQQQIMAEQEANYQAKLKLVEEAEAIKTNTNWKETADRYAAIMEEWKAIGRVPYEKADEIWNRLQEAKNHFYSAKREHAESYRLNLEDNYAQKKALLDRMETLKDSIDWRTATDEINELWATWKSIGPIPREYGDSLWEQFVAARQYFFKRKDDDREARKQRFTQQIKSRLEQSHTFLATLKSELEEDENRLSEFMDILSNHPDEDTKDKEIKANLQKLVEQLERKIPNKRAKIADVEAQIRELEEKLQNEKKKTTTSQ